MKKTGYKSITLITTPGKGMPLVEQLFKNGLYMVDLNHARGSFIGGPTKKNGVPTESEQEILTCVVSSKDANEVFGLIFDLGGVSQPNGGFMYMQDLVTSTQVTLPAESEKAV